MGRESLALRRRKLVAALTAVLSIIAVGVPLASAREPNRPPNGGRPSSAIAGPKGGGDAAWRNGMRRERARIAKLGGAAAKAARRRSRTRYRRLRHDEAIRLSRRAFADELKGHLFDGDKPDGATDVEEQRDGGTAVAMDDDGTKSLLTSSLPLEAKTEGGGEAPVDLSLTSDGDSLEPITSAAPFELTKRSAAEVEFPELGGLSFELKGAEDRTAQVVADRAFYTSVEKDTDAAISPTPTGVELNLQIRSVDSPERFVIDVDLPKGATLRRARVPAAERIPNDPPRSLEVVRRGRPIAYVHPPIAHDADLRTVQTSMSLDGPDIVVAVEHRDRDLKYPLLVDPEVNSYSDINYPWPGWSWAQVLYGNSAGFGSARNNCAYYCGLYQSHPTNTFITDTSYAYWYYRAPVNTFLYRVRFGGMAHSSITISGRNHTNWFNGIMNGSFSGWEGNANYANASGQLGPNPFGPAEHNAWGQDHDFCFNPRCDRRSGTEQNYGMFALQTDNKFSGYPDGIQSGSQKATNTMAWANIYLGDRRNPYLTGGLPGDKGWRDDGSGETAVTPSAHDDGLGVYSFALSGAASGSRTQTLGCTGNPSYLPCRADSSATFAYRLDEGISRMSVSAQDAVDNPAGVHRWIERIDRSLPDVKLSGALFDRRGGVVRTDDLSLRVDATDGNASSDQTARSGVKSIEVLIDGARASAGYSEQGCPQGSCPAGLDFTLRPGEYAEGRHSVQVIVTDQSGHVARPASFGILIDRTAPRLSLDGPLREQEGKELTDGIWTMDAFSEEPDKTHPVSGVRRIEVLVDGQPLKIDDDASYGLAEPEVPCPDPDGLDCDVDYTDVPYNTADYEPGERSITVRASDFAGNSTTEEFRIGSSRRDKPCSSPEFTVYNVGPRLEGLDALEAVRLCAPADPDFPELGRKDNVTYLYGECPTPEGEAAGVEGGCLPPIEVQSTPVCQKHRGLYQQAEMRWEYEDATIKGVPAAIFDSGRIIEIYTRDTTITIYGREREQALRFANALKLALEEDVPAVGQTLNALAERGTLAPVLPVLPPPLPGTLQETQPCG